MEDNTSTGISVFHQICEINELDPQEITQEAQQKHPDKFKEGPDAEVLIQTAFEGRAKNLLDGFKLKSGGGEYTIDAYPAAPAFMLHEEYIRSTYSKDEAKKLIEALGQVKLPVTG